MLRNPTMASPTYSRPGFSSPARRGIKISSILLIDHENKRCFYQRGMVAACRRLRNTRRLVLPAASKLRGLQGFFDMWHKNDRIFGTLKCKIIYYTNDYFLFNSFCIEVFYLCA